MNRYFQSNPQNSPLLQPAVSALHDNGGRRWGIERRRFEYTSCIPERRGGQERRSGQDRRHLPRLTPQAGFFRS